MSNPVRATTHVRSSHDPIFAGGGVFQMGSDRHYPEEAPRHLQSVDPFWLSPSPVTNAQFEHFVRETGFVSDHENPSNGMQVGGAVFCEPMDQSDLEPDGNWWRYREHATWRKPDGLHSLNNQFDDHPVLQATFADALAYARWVEGDLPTEAEWEFAASFGQGDNDYPWGSELVPISGQRANFWVEGFPFSRSAGLSPWGTSPVHRYEPNALGAYDMIGNVWEWTKDHYKSSHQHSGCCGKTSDEDNRVIKGGSHLCSPAYCRRYRSSARHPQDASIGTSHIGFRVVWRDPEASSC